MTSIQPKGLRDLPRDILIGLLVTSQFADPVPGSTNLYKRDVLFLDKNGTVQSRMVSFCVECNYVANTSCSRICLKCRHGGCERMMIHVISGASYHRECAAEEGYELCVRSKCYKPRCDEPTKLKCSHGRPICENCAFYMGCSCDLK